MEALQLLTFSRQAAFKECRKKHWFAYEKGVRTIVDAKALRMGSAYHLALEVIQKGGSFDKGCEAIWSYYSDMPSHYDAYGWEIERETVIRLLSGYVWRWENQTIEIVATEQSFCLPLINPDTGLPSRTFQLAGKIDGIIRLEDGRLNVLEHKLLGEDLGDDAQLWKRCKMDHQISLYVYAARELGFPVDGVTYNASRKPTIGACAVPLVDSNGIKIVVDANGERAKNKNGSWKQTTDTANGLTLQTRPMTAQEWGEKLIADIQDRPDYYYVRKEIPRLDSHIVECREELWDIGKSMREAQLYDRHYRTVNRNSCPYCSYFAICAENIPLDRLPEGFQIVTDIHPELNFDKGESNECASSTAGQNTAGTTAAAESVASGA